MNAVRALIDPSRKVFAHLMSHPAAAGRRTTVLARAAGWQVRKRVWSKPMLIEAFDGGWLWCHPDNVITSAVVYLGWPDWAEMRLVRDVLRPGDGFLDVGANVGVYTVLALTRVGREGRVLALEPEPKLFQRLVENLKLNGSRADAAHQIAVGERAGTCRFDVGRDALGSVLADESGRGVEVQLRRLDDLVADPGDFLVGKVDVEGYELSVFRGARRLLQAKSPKCWLVETNQAARKYGTDRAELQSFLAEFGYHLYDLGHDGGSLRRIPRGGPFPANSVATCDPDWVRERLAMARSENR